MTATDKLSSQHQYSVESNTVRAERAQFLIRKLTDDELAALFGPDQERGNLAAALGCTPATILSLAAAEDCIRCLSRPLVAAQATAMEAS